MLLALLPVYCHAQGWPTLNTTTTVTDMRLGPSWNGAGGNTGVFKWTSANELGIFTWADGKPIRIGGTLVKFQHESGNSNNVYMSGKLGVGILPSTYTAEIAGNTKIAGTTFVLGQVGINQATPSCVLDINDGNLVPNVMKLRGVTTAALSDIQSSNSGTITASPLKTGIFVNRTDVDDVNTSGAEIHGQTLGIRTSAIATSTANTTGINVQSLTPDGAGTGIYVVGTGSTQSYGINARGTSNVSPNSYGVYGYAWSGASTINAMYGIYGDIFPTYWSTPNCYAGYFNGNVIANGTSTATSFITSSDKKLKKDIVPLSEGLNIISKLKPSTYTFRTDEYKFMNLPKEKQYGFIAQELEEVLPEAVKEVTMSDDKKEKFTYKGVNYIELIPVLTKAIQEQQVQIEAQQKEIESLKATMAGNTTDIKGAGSVNSGSLSQNVPNPFSQSTVISYKLTPGTQNAAIGIYDLNGKEIKMIALGAETTGSVTIAAGDLQPGMYVYSLIINGAISDTKKMVVASH